MENSFTYGEYGRLLAKPSQTAIFKTWQVERLYSEYVSYFYLRSHIGEYSGRYIKQICKRMTNSGACTPLKVVLS